MDNQMIYQFEPSMFLFVGLTGQQVYEHFHHLEPLIPSPLHEGMISLFLQDDLEHVSVIYCGQESFKGRLEDVFVQANQTVTDARLARQLTDNNYRIINAQPTIYLIGQHDDLLLGEILKFCLSKDQNNQAQAIFYLIDTDEELQVMGNVAQAINLTDRYAPNITVFFQNMAAMATNANQVTIRAHADKGVRVQTMAEALFGFCVTGVNAYAPFPRLFTQGTNRLTMQNTLLGQLQGGQIDNNIIPEMTLAAAGTSMLEFPRQPILQYDSFRKMTPGFLDSENLPTPANRYDETIPEVDELDRFFRKTLHGTANAHRIPLSPRQRRLNVSFLRPNFNEILSETYPDEYHLQIIGDLKEKIRTRNTHEATLFNSLKYRNVLHKTNRHISFAQAVFTTNTDASVQMNYWESVRTSLWDIVIRLLRLRIVDKIEDTWYQQGPIGVRKAERLAFELSQRLEIYQSDLEDSKKKENGKYRDERSYFDDLVKDIDLQEESANRKPIDPAFPPSKPGDPAMPSDPAPKFMPLGLRRQGGGEGENDVPLGRGMEKTEKNIALKFGRAIDVAEGKIPPVSMLVAVGISVFIPLWVVWSVLIPPFGQFAAEWPRNTAIALGILIAVGEAIYYGIRYYHWRFLQRQLLAFHRVYYAHKMEEWEHVQRIRTLTTLRTAIRRIQQRLHAFDAFRAQLAHSSDTERKMTNERLWSSPAAARDIYYANGSRLTKDADYTMDTYCQELDKLIENSESAWINNPNQVFQRYMEYIHKNHNYFIDLEIETIHQYVVEFLGPKIDGFISPQHSDIRNLLQLDFSKIYPEILPELDDKSTVLTNNVAIENVAQFVATSESLHQLIVKSGQWLQNDELAPIQRSDWMMKIRFCIHRGSIVLPNISIDRLFPKI